ncbi:iron-containing alcohol dehydrogenase [Alicyclobacillus fastidiosus]|uniref:Iron-containing alcohol dehydrogenase n=1 Tax=Alicyclobacillus fastidiosus TaxID=392011 RepID=A0ABY6ZMT5_9BACL|nr:iron-containing alcohol dehydrogenase [Alicyclobacillus fastidiosus]WAH43409.1 iron-containing alcohol dehydrogenase [Alicyclobacillus fastidiosus]GMA65481.1 1,3-propanediol dehydrogenase [Alicyclobacillus fastidiosus]
MSSVREFRVPELVYTGVGSLQKITTVVPSVGSKALIVSDAIMTDLGYVARVAELLASAGVAHEVYSGVDAEPTDVHVEEALGVFAAKGCDVVIGLGGGSCIDAAKAVAVMAVNQGYIGDYMGERKWFNEKAIPLIAIPTTAGTGSEVSSVTVITNTKDDIKMMIRQRALIPSVAIVDPALTISSPPNVTAATGIDALCHAIEAYLSKRSHPLTDTLALSAIQKIVNYIGRAYANGEDLDAREAMSIAAMEAGMAFTNASVGLVHGMSRPIGAIFHVPHGVSNAMLLPTVLEYSKDACTQRLADIGRVLNPSLQCKSDEDLATYVVEQVKQLCASVKIPNMQQWGIDVNEFERVLDKMATDAIASGSPANNPKVPLHDEIVELYKTAYTADFAVVKADS